MFMFHHRDAGQNKNVKGMNKSFDSVAELKYLGTIVTDQNCTHEQIKSRLNSGNAYYHSVQNRVSKLSRRSHFKSTSP
jgi:hypothetical protein